jgi:hypothetical protein
VTIDVDVPRTQFFIFVNTTHKRINDYFAKHKVSKEFIGSFMDKFDNNTEGNSGFYWITEGGMRVMWLDKFRNKWDDLDVINHEVSHLVDFESLRRGFKGETEFKAYLHEMVFKKIREALVEEYDKQILKKSNK